MKLRYLLQKTEFRCTKGNLEVDVTDVCSDSRAVCQGSLFVCIRGFCYDGVSFIPEAITRGAFVIVLENNALASTDFSGFGGTVICVDSARKALANIAAAFYDYPATKLTTIGITGTKGKTTTSYMIRDILKLAGRKVGLIGTIEIIIGETHIAAGNTTPESVAVQKYLAAMVEAGMDSVVMEVSSQGLKLARTDGIVFDYGIFTNLGEDHIGDGEHRDMEEYIACKGMLFKQCRMGIVNCDDPMWNRVLDGCTCSLCTFGRSDSAMYKAEQIGFIRDKDLLGVSFVVSGKQSFTVRTGVPGLFNVYNALAAIALCDQLHISAVTMQHAISGARVKGRMEPVNLTDQFTVLIDYAHNAMSLESLLRTLRDYQPRRIICLFGCGGNRSKLRRFEMGEVSGRLADFTIITSDNPRYENPQDIIEDIKTGILATDGQFVEICDRREAIYYALCHGQPGDIIVLAGKGHETYQEISGEKYPMDERQICQYYYRNCT